MNKGFQGVSRAAVEPFADGRDGQSRVQSFAQEGKSKFDVLPCISRLILNADCYIRNATFNKKPIELASFSNSVVTVDPARRNDQWRKSAMVSLSHDLSRLGLIGSEDKVSGWALVRWGRFDIHKGGYSAHLFGADILVGHSPLRGPGG